MKKRDIFSDLHTIIGKVQMDEPLQKYTFTKTGGTGDVVVFPNSYQEVQKAVKYAKEHKIPVTILGNGSNLIIKDGGIRGIVIHTEQLSQIERSGNEITAQCGATIIHTSRFALQHSLSGLEFACGIPGTVGGAVYMNAGAYHGEVVDVIKSALVLDENGEFLTLTKAEMGLGYRTSEIAKKGYLVLEATFDLLPDEQSVIKEKMDELTYLRELKQPLEFPSCGSVFKRPPNLFAGKLIQDSGLQGAQIGGAQVSTKHAGFIVNIDRATATDYLHLIKHVQDTVQAKFNVQLETEVKIIGED